MISVVIVNEIYVNTTEKSRKKTYLYKDCMFTTIVQSICIAVDPVYTVFRLLFCFPLDSALYKFH